MSNFETDCVPPELWGRDHWTTLAYIETVMCDCGGFQVGRDAHMRSSRRNFRVMAERCPNPKRHGRNNASHAIPMSLENSTVLNDGTMVKGHDDWACIQDMAAVGLFTVPMESIEPKVTLHLSPLGGHVANELRRWKSGGKSFADFRAPQFQQVLADMSRPSA